jgi:hypothetical protein
MSIDPDRLHQALQFFGVALPEGVQASDLAELLGVPEEILPWLALRANAFADHGEIEQALHAAAARAPTPGTSRAPANAPSLALHDATRELDEALGALIREDLNRQELALAADARLSELVRMSAADKPFQPHNYVAVSPQNH